VHAWELFKSSAPRKRFTVSALRYDPSLDLTIVESAAPHSISLRTTTTAPATGDPIVVVGYPQWHSLGDRLTAAPCQLIQLKTISGIRFVLTNATLREGNSGGPMLNRNGNVVAVALYDGSNGPTPNSGIDISHLADLSGASSRKL
jgi:S1-C subfamily serine protease